MSVTELRAGIADALDAVENDAEELIITRAGHEPMVVVSLAEYEALKETDHLLRSPAMAQRLRRINSAHRLVYRIDEDAIIHVVACRFRYER